MPAAFQLFQIEDCTDNGWPFAIMAAHELELINCPHLVIPATFQTRDRIVIEEREVRIEIVFDAPPLIMVTGTKPPLILVDQLIGKLVGPLIDVPQLQDHPLGKMTVGAIEVVENGFDIELH